MGLSRTPSILAPAQTVGIAVAELLCGLDPAMTRYDAVRTVDQDRTGKAEFLDAGCNLSDLLGAMRARVAIPPFELRRVLIGYLQGRHNAILLIRYNRE
jgi:hypothetical protein